jgi:hypothetical protein
MVIGCSFITAIGGYWWLLVPILLVVINGYYISGYWWLLWMAIGEYFIMDIGGY